MIYVCRYFCKKVGEHKCCFECDQRYSCKERYTKPCHYDLISELDYEDECVHCVQLREEEKN